MITLTLCLPNFCCSIKLFQEDDLVKDTNPQYLVSTLIIVVIVI